MLKPHISTRPTQPKAQDSGQRQLKHPPDSRGPLIDLLSRNSRGVNTADPAIEDPSATFPPSVQVDSYRSSGAKALEMAEAGSVKNR
jgi:hypothetical protein